MLSVRLSKSDPVAMVQLAAIEAAHLPSDTILREETALLDAGLDSFTMLTMLSALSHAAGVDLPSELVGGCPTVDSIAKVVAEKIAEKAALGPVQKEKKMCVATREFEGEQWWIEDVNDERSGLHSAKEGNLELLKEQVAHGWKVFKSLRGPLITITLTPTRFGRSRGPLISTDSRHCSGPLEVAFRRLCLGSLSTSIMRLIN